MRFRQVLVTRLNVPHREGLNLDERWWWKRLDLFRRLTLPSVAAQVNQDFRWLVFGDVRTPLDWVNELLPLRSVRPFESIWIGDRFEAQHVRDAIAMMEWDDPKWEAEYLVTTRLDADDALAVDFTFRIAQMVRDAGEALDRHLLDLTHGIEWHNGELQGYRALWPCNAFVSLCERWHRHQQPWTVFARPLDELPQLALRVIRQEGRPAWLKCWHDTNSLQAERLSTVPASFDWEEFGI